MFKLKEISMLCALTMVVGPILTACSSAVTPAPTPLSGAQAAATSVPSTVTSVPPTTTPVPPIVTSVLPTASPELKVQSDLLGHVVTSNGQWTPVIQKFDVAEMALVPAGCFKMGSTPAQVEEAYQRCVRKWGECQRRWFGAENPQHEICFKEPFWIDRYEVTNKQYGSSGKFPGDDIPRDSVNWFDAAAFCKRRGGHLPTEAEWQYAARGPDGLAYPWGNKFTGKLLNSCDRNCTMDWRDAEMDDGYATTSPVGSFPGGASWVGALDMSGNLWEWVSSIHRPYPYDATDGREVDGNADSTSSRVSFGGAWDLDGDHARLAFRNWNEPSFADYAMGFRCARSYTLADAPPTVALVPPAATLVPLTPAPTLRPLAELADLKNDQGPAYSQGWSPDGKLLAVAGYDQVSLWNVGARQRVAALKHPGYVWGVAWSPDGARLASASQDGTVKLWDAKTYQASATLDTGWAFCVAWSPDGKELAVGTNSGQVQIWNIQTGEVARKLNGTSMIIGVAWSPDGRILAAGQWSGSILLWDACSASGERLATLVGSTTTRSDVNGVAWSPNGQVLASAHQDGKVRLWNVQNGQLLQTIEAHDGWARGVAWSPNGRWLASTGEDKQACLWNAETGQQLAEAAHDHLPVWSVAWSPDSKYISTGDGVEEQSLPGTVIVWAVPSSSN